MTSASELFYTRRSRFGRADPDLAGLDSSPERTLRGGFGRHRRESEGCEPLRRSQRQRLALNRVARSESGDLWLRLCLEEHKSVRFNEGVVQSDSGNIVNAEILINGPRLTGNDRLPGAVLQAKERLLQRLRGVSQSENTNRQSRASPGSHHNRPVINSSIMAMDAEDFPDMTSQVEHLQTSQPGKQKPPGLNQHALDSLQLEVFRTVENPASRASSDCSICLESFAGGDRLTRLQCGHRFHPPCLNPWVRTCGNCPYCRRSIVL